MNRRSLAAFLLLASACAAEAPAPQPRVDPRVGFAVKDRSNGSPSIAAFGKTVAVVWTASTDSQSDIFMSVSTDSGTQFGPPVRVNDLEGDARTSGEQPPRVAVGSGAIHVAWPSRRDGHSVIRYASSTDSGRSFSPAVSIAGETLTGARGWQSMSLLHDGTVHLVWLDGRNAVTSKAGSSAAAKAPPHHAHASGGSKSAMGSAPRQDILHALLQKDGGPSESPVAANVCFCCKTAVVTSGENVYAAWRHIYPGSIRDIAYAQSKDRGRTFGQPVRVSEDNWRIEACPDDGPAMAADEHGGVHIAWPTLLPGDTPRKGIFYSALKDGKPFTPRLRVDSGEADPAHPQIAAEMHGSAMIVWDERREGGRRIALRHVSGETVDPPEFFDGAGVSYPAVAFADGQWIVVWTAQQPNSQSVIEGRRIPFKH
jgi:hypothetical protein